MSLGRPRPLAEAEPIAHALVEQLRPACERIELAGSIRRRCREVSDVELVAVPRLVNGPTETEFFRHCGLPFLPPEQRR